MLGGNTFFFENQYLTQQLIQKVLSHTIITLQHNTPHQGLHNDSQLES